MLLNARSTVFVLPLIDNRYISFGGVEIKGIATKLVASHLDGAPMFLSLSLRRYRDER